MVEDILREYESDLKSYCRMLTGTPWDAEDLYQNILLKCLKVEDKLCQHPAPRALLFKMASNTWIDECRKRKAEIGIPDDYEKLNGESDTYSFDVKETLEYLVATVPPFQVAVVLLTDVFNYTAREAASMLEKTEGAVKAALHRARTRLRKMARTEALQKGSIRQKSTREQAVLIEHFLEAFRQQEPMGIADTYRRLNQAGIRTERQVVAGKLHFSFYDPEGNAFTVLAK